MKKLTIKNKVWQARLDKIQPRHEIVALVILVPVLIALIWLHHHL